LKGKPWTPEEEKQLRELLEVSKPLEVIAKRLGKTENAIRQKMIKLGLKEEKKPQREFFSSTALPEDLPSIEEALKTLYAALETLNQPGLNQSETLRLRSIIQGVKIYKELFADYVDYRGIEAELVEMRKRYEELAKKAEGVSTK